MLWQIPLENLLLLVPENSGEHDSEECKSEVMSIRDETARMLSHFPTDSAERITAIFVRVHPVTCSLWDLRPANVSIQHPFERTSSEPANRPGSRANSKQNQLARDEVVVMLDTSTITSC